MPKNSSARGKGADNIAQNDNRSLHQDFQISALMVGLKSKSSATELRRRCGRNNSSTGLCNVLTSAQNGAFILWFCHMHRPGWKRRKLKWTIFRADRCNYRALKHLKRCFTFSRPFKVNKVDKKGTKFRCQHYFKLWGIMPCIRTNSGLLRTHAKYIAKSYASGLCTLSACNMIECLRGQ